MTSINVEREQFTSENIKNLNLDPQSPMCSKMVPLINEGRDLVITIPSDNLVEAIKVILAGFTSKAKLDSGSILVVTPNAELMESLGEAISDVVEKMDVIVRSIPVSSKGSRSKSTKLFLGTATDCSSAIEAGDIEAASVSSIILVRADLIHSTVGTEVLEKLLEPMGDNIQGALLGESVPPQIAGLARKYFETPQYITPEVGSESSADISHVYHEVGGDVLSKPNALGDLVETETGAVIVFCNQRSDADFVLAILKKRGISAAKVNEDSTYQQTNKLMEQVSDGEIKAVVATDFAISEIDGSAFSTIINYSIPSEPEIYLDRTKTSGKSSKLSKVVSLVAPLDFSNFHFVKKVAGVDFNKIPLPGTESIKAAKFDKILKEAIQLNLTDEGLVELKNQILAHENKDAVLVYLLHKVLNVLPSLESRDSANQSGGNRRENRDDAPPRRDFRDDRGGRRNDNRGGDNRSAGSDRGGRGGDRRRDDRGDFRDGDRSRTSDRQRRSDRGGHSERRGDFQEGDNRPAFDSSSSSSRSDRDDDRDNRPAREFRQHTPPKKDLRLYIGHGTKDGLTNDKLSEIISTQTTIPKEDLHRLMVRDAYTFADFDEAKAEQVMSELEKVTINNAPMFVKKATVIPSPREDNNRNENNSGGDIDSVAVAATNTEGVAPVEEHTVEAV